MMKRRDFIKSAACAGVAVGCLPGFSLAGTEDSYVKYAKHFQRELANNPLLRGWQGVDKDIAPTTVNWQGRLPKELEGRHFYRNGPGLRELNGVRLKHWFDGNGFVNHYALSASGMTHQGKFVRTRRFTQEQEAGRFIYADAGTHVPNAKMPNSSHHASTANISLMPVNQQLWALWEVGAPYALDPITLETTGEVALNEHLSGIPFSAHPHQDKDGSWWNFGDLSFAGKASAVLYHLSQQGELQRFNVIDLPKRSYLHDFALTDRYIVLYMTPLVMTQHQEVYLESFEWQPSLGGELVVIDKNTLTVSSVIPMDAGFIFHFGNSWQQGNELVINACWYDDAYVVMEGMGDLTRQHGSFDKSVVSTIRVDLNKKTARLEKSSLAMEFPLFDDRYLAGKTRFQTGVTTGINPAQYSAIGRFDQRQDNMSLYDYGRDVIVEEPLYVPKSARAAEGSGYLIHSWLDYQRGVTGVSVLDTGNLKQGPVAQAELPYYLPLGFHGTII